LLIRLAVPGLVAADYLPDEEERNVVEYDEPRSDGVSVVTLDGRIVPGDESNALREKLKVSLAKNDDQLLNQQVANRPVTLLRVKLSTLRVFGEGRLSGSACRAAAIFRNADSATGKWDGLRASRSAFQ